MHTDTLFLTLVILAQSPLVSFIRMGIEEVILKPLAIRHTKRVLGALAEHSEVLKEAWDTLDYSLVEALRKEISRNIFC